MKWNRTIFILVNMGKLSTVMQTEKSLQYVYVTYMELL